MTLSPVRGWLPRVVLLALVGLSFACSAPSPPPEVEYSGCWAFYSSPEPVCVLRQEHKLKLWVRTRPGDRVEIRAGDQKLKDAEHVARAGLRYSLTLPEKATALTVTVYSPAGSKEGATWLLRTAEPDKPAWLDEIGRLSPQAARKRLEDLRRSAPREMQCLVLAFMAERAGDPREQDTLLRQRVALCRTDHHWSGEVAATTFLAHLYIDQGRFSEAAQILRALQPPPKAPADDKYHVMYSLGLLEENTSNYGAALKHLQQAADLAQRVGMLGLERGADQVLALMYQELGRSPEASRLIANLLLQPVNTGLPCDVGAFWINVGWFQLMEREAGNAAEDPAPALQKALAQFQKNACLPHQLPNAYLNLALAYQQQDQWSKAEGELARAQALSGQSGLSELLWQGDLEARVALHEGHQELALGLYEKLEKRSERAAFPAGVLRALLGQANAYIALGRRPAAIDALAKADSQIETQSRHIPVLEGRDTFFAYQEAATRLYLKLLLDQEQREKALDLARKSRSRLLRQLAVRDRLSQLNEKERKTWLGLLSKYHDTRDAVDSDAAKRWRLPFSEQAQASEGEAEKLKGAQEELDSALGALEAFHDTGEGSLSPPAPGEVVLAYHPLPGKQWVAFAATEHGRIGLAYFELPGKLPEDPRELARLLLAPSPSFRSAIASAGSVRILPYGPLRTVDFHALPFAGGQPLLATHLVAYSLDLSRRSAPVSRSGHPMALVVSNPTRDLARAEAEGKTVAAAIKSWPGLWEPKSLNGSAAKAGEVRDVLTRASFFHYAGHGSFGGFAGWSSELLLADESRLTLSDILTLSPAPDSIVLSACDAGRTSQEAPGEGVGLANAFLLAGAKEVVAARQSVPDDSSNQLMTEMYRHWQPGEDLAHQLRRAQLACGRMSPSPCPSWASFRLLVP